MVAAVRTVVVEHIAAGHIVVDRTVAAVAGHIEVVVAGRIVVVVRIVAGHIEAVVADRTVVVVRIVVAHIAVAAVVEQFGHIVAAQAAHIVAAQVAHIVVEQVAA